MLDPDGSARFVFGFRDKRFALAMTLAEHVLEGVGKANSSSPSDLPNMTKFILILRTAKPMNGTIC